MSLTKDDLLAIEELLDKKYASIEDQIASIQRNVLLLAENSSELNRKYNDAVPMRERMNAKVLEVQMCSYFDRLERLERDLAELKAKIA
ncbi:MAG: hypothetical protein IJT32_05010 [Lachnospiraceae bacterium]|nr:hypothetical protein [Lachnospiraceae bacterium]